MNSEDTSNATVAATGKLAFEDVPNTQDARIMLEDYVFGGTYNFAVIKIGASKALNRNEFDGHNNVACCAPTTPHMLLFLPLA